MELDLYFMITLYIPWNLTYILWLHCIYLCVKYESNTPTFFKKYRKENIFWRWKRAITPKIIGGFTLNRTSPTFYDYIPVYKISIQHINLFNRYLTKTICVTYGKGGRTDSGDTICPPTENGRGINKNIPPLPSPATRITDLAQL